MDNSALGFTAVPDSCMITGGIFTIYQSADSPAQQIVYVHTNVPGLGQAEPDPDCRVEGVGNGRSNG